MYDLDNRICRALQNAIYFDSGCIKYADTAPVGLG